MLRRMSDPGGREMSTTSNELRIDNWDLDSLFSGGAESPAVTAALADVDARLLALTPRVAALPELSDAPATAELDAWADVLDALDALSIRLGDVNGFAHCLAAAHAEDPAANGLVARATAYRPRVEQLSVPVVAKLGAMSDAAFAALRAAPRFADRRYALTHTREAARYRMEPSEEGLAAALSDDGFHAWSRLYDRVSGALKVHIDLGDGEGTRTVSVSQTAAAAEHADRAVRKRVFDATAEAWSKAAVPCAEAINHLAGTRLTLDRRRGRGHVLDAPLHEARIQRGTLDAMMAAVEAARPWLAALLERKAALLGVERLAWWDLYAPLPQAAEPAPLDFATARDFIVRCFGQFSPAMAEFARQAFERRWIEAEDRPGKRGGGFCCPFYGPGESRIFMTFAGTQMAVATLAHELGHAWHNWVRRDLPLSRKDAPLTLAETASTFAEALVMEAAYAAAPDDAARLSILERKVREAITFCCNIPARLGFELRFHEERARGEVSVERLCALMEAAQTEAYAGRLDPAGLNPWFWASKLHFFISTTAFYNFPYTFGSLFTQGIWARAQEQGAGYADRYVELLRMTGDRPAEEVARAALGVDLAGPDYWRQALGSFEADARELINLTDSMVSR